ncbi:MAG: hypothetical protein WA197_04895 [Candidatus Acidiferrales bacterium]
MARAKLTTKTLAQRIDLDYFKHPHPFRRLRSILSIAIPLIALVWLGWYAAVRNNRVYSAGKMSSAHAVLTAKCSSCHVKEANSFSAKATDQSCDTCHSAPFHHANQTFTPLCASCHLEHRGHLRLAVTADISCTQCHADLHTIGTPTRFTGKITRFNGGHPEFAILRNRGSDPGTIKLNHAVHLKHDLRGPNGPVQMDCEDCHRTVRPAAGWRFGTAMALNPLATQTGIPPSMDAGRAYMSPVTYAEHCIACHGLQFDPRFQESVPHDTPEVIHAFLVQKFRQYIPSHPAELRVLAPHRNIPQKPIPPEVRVLTPQQWVALRVSESEELLWRKTCAQCHALGFAPNAALPAVAKSNIPQRWFRHAVFNHDAHKFQQCVECHAGAPKSQETSDVLLPGIQTCEKCHRGGREAAESRCFECHTYHDWKNERPVKGTFTLTASAIGN